MKTFDENFRKLFIPLVVFFVIIMFLPATFTAQNWFGLDFTETGQIGDTIGGIMGPFIAIAAATLTFLAFWVQFKANEQQRKDIRLERFENRFYELLQLHKSNVNELNIANKISGRKCFVPMFYELKCIYKETEETYKKATKRIFKSYEYDKINLMSFSYRIFFFGIGLNSEKHFVNSFTKGEKHLFNKLKPKLIKIQEDIFLHKEFTDLKKGFYSSKQISKNNNIDEEITFKYYPFDGHVNKLGHYYRHLFQTANYIISQEFLNEEEKYSYIKTLRAQLSNFEQLHIYYNALAWFDTEWRVIFTKYRFIKNIPLALADFHKSPEIHFKNEIQELKEKGISMFEWMEQKPVANTV